MTRSELEQAVRAILLEQLGGPQVLQVDLPQVQVTEQNRLDTGNPQDRVWTHDLLTLAQSPRLGAGLMVMEKTTFPWHLTYDEIDYVIEGRLTVHTQSGPVTAGPGQVIFIPKGSQIQFSAPEFARFLYVTYPGRLAKPAVIGGIPPAQNGPDTSVVPGPFRNCLFLRFLCLCQCLVCLSVLLPFPFRVGHQQTQFMFCQQDLPPHPLYRPQGLYRLQNGKTEPVAQVKSVAQDAKLPFVPSHFDGNDMLPGVSGQFVYEVFKGVVGESALITVFPTAIHPAGAELVGTEKVHHGQGRGLPLIKLLKSGAKATRHGALPHKSQGFPAQCLRLRQLLCLSAVQRLSQGLDPCPVRFLALIGGILLEICLQK